MHELMLHWTGYPPLIAAALYVATLYYSVKGDSKRAKKFLTYASIALLVSWLLYLIPFVTLDFSLHEVYWNSSEGMPLWMRIATSWSGGGGSLFLFTMLAGMTLFFLRDGGIRLYLAAIPVILVGLFAAYMNDAFTLIPGHPITGAGLNPLLKSPWLYPHPLSTFGGYGILAISAIALALGYRRGRATYNVGWALLTIGIMLGALWSYETFGWGGYWAWDPVETSELMVWLAATLYPHLVPILPNLARAFAALVPSSVFLAMFVTRTGLSPLHSFAGANAGSLSLLIMAIVYLLWWLRELAEAENPLKPLKSAFKNPQPYYVGTLLAAIALGIAAFFVYGTLFVPSLMVAMGHEASVPQMSDGIKYFHPVLYPLLILMLVALPMVLLNDWGWKAIIAAEVTVLLTSAVATIAALMGYLKLAHLSPNTTNAMMAFGIPLTGFVMASAVYYIIKRYKNLKDIDVGLLHFGMALTALGVLMSGTYAFNSNYFYHFNLPPGTVESLPNGMKLSLSSFHYKLGNSFVDIYDRYVQKSSVYFYAWLALKAIAHDVSPYLQFMNNVSKTIKSNPLLQFIVDKVLHGQPIYQSDNVMVYNLTNYTLKNVHYKYFYIKDLMKNKQKLINSTGVLNSTGGTVVLYLWRTRSGDLGYSFSIDVKNLIIDRYLNLTPHDVLEFKLEKPIVIKYGDIVVRSDNITVYPAATPIAIHMRTMIPEAFTVLHGVVIFKNGTYPSTGTVSSGIMIYLKGLQDPLIKSLMHSELGKFLENPENVKKLITPPPGTKCIHQDCAGYVRAPRYIPETAMLTLNFKVIVGNSTHDFHAKIRYEAYGEIQGIHGLVPKVIHPSYGISDLYVVLNPPVAQSHVLMGASYHDLLLWYLHELFNSKNYTLGQKLALAALFAAGYNINVVNQIRQDQLPTYLELATLELYLMAKNYTSLIKTEGLYVQAKVIPGAIFVWTGPIIMAIAALIGAFVYRTPRTVSSTSRPTSTTKGTRG
ncbi:hypothetical protein IPA_05660 [Ignicoccus pacificus DSM 13166]|uniref:Cytochrome c assembly protein domain-containing protein n=1 Tax=Ignicoccus pacificus DSM 13166 TaxID=940294 RepID=A0A977KBD2_9CREN|nr:hypothetical protein IPA_05660 [Ignicoccus pacificus DSM 13166]